MEGGAQDDVIHCGRFVNDWIQGMLIATMAVLGGLALLVLGADRFVTGAAGTARALGVSTLVIGLIVVGIATSMPEVFVGGVAAWDGKTRIAIGNALGSNIANIGLVLGATALLAPIVVQSQTLRREFLLMLAAMLIAFLLMSDLRLARVDGLLLLGSLGLMLTWIVYQARREAAGAQVGEEQADTPGRARSIVSMLVGLTILLAGAELLVRGAVHIARELGVDDLVIGLTIVAVGTSLPELAASLMSMARKEMDLALGNVIGSNMFNMLMVLGIPCIIYPDAFGREVLWRDFSVMSGLTLLMAWMVFFSGKNRYSRVEGGILLLCFAGYQYWLFHG